MEFCDFHDAWLRASTADARYALLTADGAGPHHTWALQAAILGGDAGLVEFLLHGEESEAELPPNPVTLRGIGSPWKWGSDTEVQILLLILEAGMRLRQPVTYLERAMEMGHDQLVQALSLGSLAGMVSEYGVWSTAVDCGYADVLAGLLSADQLHAGGALTYAGHYTSRLLWRATDGPVDQPNIVGMLLAAGAVPLLTAGLSPLVTASSRGHTETVRLLLAAGADPADFDHGALKTARARGHAEIEAMLLAAPM